MGTRCRNMRLPGRVFAFVLFLGSPAIAQDAGTVIAVEPTAEIGRAGSWLPASAGATVQQGDLLRTGRPGRISILLRDDSVVHLSEGSELAIDSQLLAPEEDTARSVLRLVQGKIRSLVSDFYEDRRGSFEVRTPTALAGVRGTDFVVVYDDTTEVTEVVGVSGRIVVHSIDEPERFGVQLSAQEITTVARGQLPQPPRKLSERLFRQYIEGLELLGVTGQGSAPFAQSVLAGAAVPEPDLAINAPPPPPPPVPQLGSIPDRSRFATPDPSTLLGQPPPVIDAGSTLGIEF